MLQSKGLRHIWIANFEHDSPHVERRNSVTWRVGRNAGAAGDLRALFDLTLILFTIRPLVVHLHTPKAGFIGLCAAYLVGTPVRIFQVHGKLSDSRIAGVGMVGAILEFLLNHGSGELWPVANWIRNDLARNSLAAFRKVWFEGSGSAGGIDCSVQFNPQRFSAIDRDRLRGSLKIDPSAQIVGFVGRFGREKGSEEVIACWNKISASRNNLYLIIVGGIETRYDTMEEIRVRLKNADRVRFVGWTADVANYYGLMDVLLFPSWREGLPYALLEACAMGVPVIATSIPGCLEVLEDGAAFGRLVGVGEWMRMEEYLRLYLDDPERCKSEGRLARESVTRRYSKDDVIAQQADRIDKVCRLANGCVI